MLALRHRYVVAIRRRLYFARMMIRRSYALLWFATNRGVSCVNSLEEDSCLGRDISVRIPVTRWRSYVTHM